MPVSFDELVAANHNRLHRICRAYLPHDPAAAQDLYQEMLVQLWTCLPGYRGEAQLGTWVYRVAVNTALLFQRREQRQPTARSTSFDLAESLPAETDEAARALNTLLDQLHHCIALLPDADRLLVSLLLEDASYQQIAEVLGLSVSNVGVRLNRLKKKMAACVAPARLAD
ncbi:RNA polymerase sigma factor [Hymenobacter rigui]|uniref:Sigma-70 family RNA polymerase sigma factor n=1 Tax=Hymenobacter rigui TaxID=334424 RepID=A0A3R9N8I0_9BACT|nr:sigma-70 family RNA polymerase sigma factor [Hymenobacter rigui]RSK50855.1 sigma-70 family RNA polymerase sigma factor [Hymenobacter rigui]